MKLRYAFRPNPGKVAVVREFVDEVASRVQLEDGSVKQIFMSEETKDWERKVNPWAFVVAVGARRMTDNGKWIETDILVGDKVLIAQVGLSVKLDDGQGGDYIYVLPFEGVLGRLEYECPSCGYRSTRHVERCPKCPDIEMAALEDISAVNRSRA